DRLQTAARPPPAARAPAPPAYGGRQQVPDRHPYAGGEGHHAAYLEDPAGYEVELVADSRPRP
ncbi:glyoxalase, partial [Streptomyces anulatus]